MPTVKVSSKYQVVIPKDIRESIDLVPGQDIEVLLLDDRIELIPIQPMPQTRGFLRGIDTTIDREPDRTL